jgi:phospholipid/cholesterol/gamma-HCH transport system substrate-binding protein
MNRSAKRDFVVGLFVLVGLGAIAYLSLSVGGWSLRGPGDLVLFADFDQIGGLKPRAQVEISGVKVGQVESITLNQDYRARVRMALRSNLELPVDTSASIVTAGLLGDRYVSLQLGGEEKTLKPGDDIRFTQSAVMLESLIGKFIYGSESKNDKDEEKSE